MIPKYWKSQINPCKNCGTFPLSREYHAWYSRTGKAWIPRHIQLYCPTCGQRIEQDFYTQDNFITWKLLTYKWNEQNNVEEGELMNKEQCKDCIGLTEGYICDELQKPIREVKQCIEEDDVDMSGVLDDYDDDEINMSGV